MNNTLSFFFVAVLALLMSACTLQDDWHLQSVVQKAKRGDVAAQAEAGKLYLLCPRCAYGPGYTCDKAEGLKWLLAAAEGGSAQAQVSLGGMYAIGVDVHQDYKQAYHWYSMAAAQGDAQALAAVAELDAAGHGKTL